MAGSQDFAEDPRNAHVLALVDGALVPLQEASVSIFDAGFGLGDGVWEGLRLHRGALLFLEAHLDRLYAGAKAIAIDIGLTHYELRAELKRLLIANQMSDGAHLRLMVTRGRKRSINQDPRHALGRATIVCTAEFKASTVATTGLNLHIGTIRTSGADVFDMHLNSHSRLNYIRALLEAIKAGADEAVMLDPNGHIASCNATNLFWVRGGEVRCASDRFCFPGITLGNVIDLCRAGAAPIRVGDFLPDDLLAADEAFVTGTMGGITPVAQVDGTVFAPGAGPVTQLLQQHYAALKDRYAQENPLL
ncbi:MAG: aminotransferase class IV [Novosphingobium sp.]|uniref:aminotransferase class IV n=1 Tax=Novosphingobium sp. TaxID=1874826 RepID=UPI003C7A3701